MATNPYFFASYKGNAEQDLVSSLMQEAIQQQGYDVHYIPREFANLDYLFGEDTNSDFTDAIEIEAYIKDFAGYKGNKELITKFGLDIGDDLTIQIHQDRFHEEVSSKYPNITRPKEGDLIYFGLDTHSIFEISYVEEKVPFFQLGNLYLYTISMKRFVYSGENIKTGNIEIDDVINYGSTTTMVLGTSATPLVTFVTGEIAYQSATDLNAATASGEVISHIGNELTLYHVKGNFVQGQNIKGELSLADWTFPLKNDTTYQDNNTNPIADNKDVNVESEVVIDRTELNPFADF